MAKFSATDSEPASAAPAMAQLATLLGRRSAQITERRQMNLALGRLRQAHQRIGQFCLTVATDTGDAVNLPGAQGHVHPAERAAACHAAQIPHLQTHLTGCCGLMLTDRHRLTRR